MFEGINSTAVIESLEVLALVQECQDPHSASIVQRLLLNTAGGNPNTVAAQRTVGWSWMEFGQYCMEASERCGVLANPLALVKQSMAKRAMPWIRENAPGFLTKLESRSKGKSTHQFWQRGGGYDRNLRSVSDIHEKIDYIHANPVRRKLVDTPGQWPWSSYHTWETGKDAPIPVDRDSVPMLTPVEEDVRRNIRRYEH